jgi:transposase-like protein
MSGAYRSGKRTDERSAIIDSLEGYVREGARQMLAAALEEEVTAFLGRGRYERGKPYRGYRNGHHPTRELTVGVGAVAVRVPRVADVPPAVAPDGFQSRVVERYQRSSKATQELFVRLYLEGLATGDFEPVFRELVGETTALSANAVVRLKERWGEEYEAWRQRPLGEHRYTYIWSDGIVRHEAPYHRVGSVSPPAVCRSRPLKLEAAWPWKRRAGREQPRQRRDGLALPDGSGPASKTGRCNAV